MGLDNFPVVTGIGFRPWQALKCKSHLLKNTYKQIFVRIPTLEKTLHSCVSGSNQKHLYPNTHPNTPHSLR